MCVNFRFLASPSFLFPLQAFSNWIICHRNHANCRIGKDLFLLERREERISTKDQILSPGLVAISMWTIKLRMVHSWLQGLGNQTANGLSETVHYWPVLYRVWETKKPMDSARLSIIGQCYTGSGKQNSQWIQRDCPSLANATATWSISKESFRG